MSSRAALVPGPGRRHHAAVLEATRPPRSLSSAAALVLLAVLILVLPMLRGGVGFAQESLALLLSVTTALLALWRSREVPWTALAMVAVVLVIGAQLVPLPPQVHALSPGAETVFNVSLRQLGEYPAIRPLALDIPATARELGKAVACLSVFLAAWSYSETRQRRSRLLDALGLSAAVVAIAVLGAGVLGYQPFLAARFPFVNPNHLAGFLDLVGFVALGLAVRTHGQDRLVWGVVFAASSAVLFATLSRGGIAAYFVGLAIFAVLFLGRQGEAPAHRRVAVLAGVTAIGLGAAMYLALGPLEEELQTLKTASQEAKIAQWPAGMRMIRDFPVLGIGRGAFSTVFPAYKTDTSVLTFTHLENEPLQVLIDLGVPGGLLLVGLVGLVWVRAARRHDLSPAEIGLLAGTGALLSHDVFDFSLEVLGVALPFSAALGLLSRGSRVKAVRPWISRAGLATLGVVGAAGLGTAAVLDHTDPALSIAAAPPELATRRGVEAVLLRPGDYLPHAAVGARLAAARRCGDAMPWLARAVALAPGIPEPHVYAARCLVRVAPVMARAEYRLAYVLGRVEVLSEAAPLWTAEELREVVPDTSDGLMALGDELARGRRFEEARQVFQRVLDEYEEPGAVLPLARLALNTGDEEGALTLARRRIREAPLDENGYAIAAQALLGLGDAADAHAVLQRGIEMVPNAPHLLGILATRLVAERRFSEARRTAELIPARTSVEVAIKEQLVATALAAHGRLPEAIEHAQSAAAAAPEDPGPLLQLAQLASEAGRYTDAVAALERASALPGAAPGAYADRLLVVRAKLEAQQQRQQESVLLPGASSLPEGP